MYRSLNIWQKQSSGFLCTKFTLQSIQKVENEYISAIDKTLAEILLCELCLVLS